MNRRFAYQYPKSLLRVRHVLSHVLWPQKRVRACYLLRLELLNSSQRALSPPSQYLLCSRCHVKPVRCLHVIFRFMRLDCAFLLCCWSYGLTWLILCCWSYGLTWHIFGCCIAGRFSLASWGHQPWRRRCSWFFRLGFGTVWAAAHLEATVQRLQDACCNKEEGGEQKQVESSYHVLEDNVPELRVVIYDVLDGNIQGWLSLEHGDFNLVGEVLDA